MTKLILAMMIALGAYAQGDSGLQPAAEKPQEVSLPVGEGEWMAVVGPEAHLALIAEDLNEALRLRESGQPGHSNLFRRAAAALARVGAHVEAIRVLDLVVEAPESGFDLASALRMQGQYWLVLGQSRQAQGAFERQLAIYDADPSLKRRFTDSYLSGISQLQSLLSARGDVEGALSVNARILANRNLFRRDTVASALEATAALHGRRGDRMSRIAAIDEILRDYAWDVVGGAVSVARLRLVRADLSDPTRSTEAYAAELRGLWDDPRLAGEVWTVETVAQRLGSALKAQGRVYESLSLAAEALDRLDAIRQRAASDDGGDDRRRIDRQILSVELTLLSVLQSAAGFGRADLALVALERLENLAPNDLERENVRMQRARLEDRLFEEFGFLEDDPIKGFVLFMQRWAAGDADYNNDGATDSLDVLLYLSDLTTPR
ncbi:MAG: hypothetical protein KIS87_01230 [Phycisphaeraceae bacterium]|nr:hypothetical protein [Phycisphaeraceae bacterium]